METDFTKLRDFLKVIGLGSCGLNPGLLMPKSTAAFWKILVKKKKINWTIETEIILLVA